MIATQAWAQVASGRVLQKANLTSAGPVLFGGGSGYRLGTTFADLFAPGTNVTCPAGSTCTLHIEVSTVIDGLNAGAQARMRVLVDNVLVSVGVTPWIPVGTNNGTGESQITPTFQWFKTNLAAGAHYRAISGGRQQRISGRTTKNAEDQHLHAVDPH